MMTFEDGTGQIVEIVSTRFAMVPLTMLLRFIEAVFDDVLVAAKWTPHPLRPTQFANFSIATCIVDEVLDIDQSHAGAILGNHVFFLRVIFPRRTYVVLSLVSGLADRQPGCCDVVMY